MLGLAKDCALTMTYFVDPSWYNYYNNLSITVLDQWQVGLKNMVGNHKNDFLRPIIDIILKGVVYVVINSHIVIKTFRQSIQK